MKNSITLNRSHRFGPIPLVIISVIAISIGIIVRFKGLGAWPLIADEYYFARSVENVLRFGFPAYECGGYYMRGVLPQYLAAGLHSVGLPMELAIRTMAATTSLLVLPAVYLLGRRFYGNTTALLTVTLVAFSVWEIEIARFGRMYAPFQAVFLWYLVYFVRYTLDRQKCAVWGMVGLSVVGVLVWEGGVLLAVANLLPPFWNHSNGRLNAAQCRYIGWMVLLLLPIYLFATGGFRYIGDVLALPPDYDAIISAVEPIANSTFKPIWLTLQSHPIWLAAVLLPLMAAGFVLPWLRQIQDRWLLVAGILLALAAGLSHLFLIVIFIIVLLLLFRLLHLRELVQWPGVTVVIAILSAASFWVFAGIATQTWYGGQDLDLLGIGVGLRDQFLGFPNFLEVIARPWARAVPILGACLLLSTVLTIVSVVVQEDSGAPNERAAKRLLLIFVITMMVLVSASDVHRTETRYSFFLYPLLLIIFVGLLVQLVDYLIKDNRLAGVLAAGVVFGGYALTEDFQPSHLWKIDTAEINFRQSMSSGRRMHYVGRTDIRAAADWLYDHADPSSNLIVSGSGVTGLDYYYPYVDFVYVDPRDHQHADWSCQRGTVERWSNLPLVYSVTTLQSRIASSSRSFLIIAPRHLNMLWADLKQLNPSIVWENENGFEIIVQFRPAQLDNQSVSPSYKGVFHDTVRCGVRRG